MFPKVPRMLVLLVLVSLLAIVVGFYTLNTAQALWFVSHITPVLIVTNVGWLLWDVVSDRQSRPNPAVFHNRELWIAGGTIAFCSSVIFFHQPYGFKVLNDELVLSANAASLHFDRVAATVLRSHQYAGDLVSLFDIVDKRPLFFVCLLSALHDITGYRVANVFVLNTAVCIGLLWSIYYIGRLLGGFTAGILALLLWTALPLVAINANGAGFELLNVLMIALVMIAANRVVRTPDKRAISVLVLCVLLLAQTRYESVLFIAPVAFLVVWVWVKQKAITIPWSLVAAPLLLVSYPLQHKVFNSPRYWELKAGRTEPFSASYFSENVGHALNFFFNPSPSLPNCILLSAVGTFGVGLLILTAVRRKPDYYSNKKTVLVLLGCGAVITANFGLMLFYHWASFDTYVVHRFTLPLHLLMVFAVVFAINEFQSGRRIWSPAVAIAVVWIFLVTIPMNARDVASKTQIAISDVEWQRHFLEKIKREDALYATAATLIPYIERIPAVPTSVLGRKKEGLRFLMDQKVYSDIYVAQRLTVDPITGATQPEENNEVDPSIELETLEERTFTPLRISRISRVTKINATATPVHPKGNESPTDAYMSVLFDSLP